VVSIARLLAIASHPLCTMSIISCDVSGDHIVQ
jgi:hypothetical protein